MLPQHVLFYAAVASAIPLNINLGAYSPALVVGDGEISLGSAESASELMSTLASGAAGEGGQQQQGQQQQGQQQEQQQGGQQQEEQNQEGEQAAEQPAANEGRAVPAPNVRTINHFGKRAQDDRLTAAQEAMEWIKRDLAGFNAALSYAREAQKDQPKVELGTGEEGSGVGVIVNAGVNVPANSAANGERPQGKRRAKRGEVVAEESEAPKMTLVAITEV